MNATEVNRTYAAASIASSISSLCALLSEALCNDPDTSIAGEAVEGVGELAQRLFQDLHKLASGEEG